MHFDEKNYYQSFDPTKLRDWAKIIRLCIVCNRFRNSIFLYLAEQNSVLDSVVEIRTLYVQGEEMPEDKGNSMNKDHIV
jgi:hypothetical protein